MLFRFVKLPHKLVDSTRKSYRKHSVMESYHNCLYRRMQQDGHRQGVLLAKVKFLSRQLCEEESDREIIFA